MKPLNHDRVEQIEFKSAQVTLDWALLVKTIVESFIKAI